MESIPHPPGFLDAVRAGDLETVRHLLDRGADPNAFEFFNPCTWACEHNHISVARLLLERGAHPNDGESTYHSAQHGHLECLELLLAHGADISSRHPHWRNTPLYFLAGHHDDHGGHARWVTGMRWLLDHGADPNVTSSAGAEAPLHALMRSTGTVAAARVLLDRGAAVDQPRADGRTPYAIAVRSGHSAGAALLAARGADVHRVSADDRFLGACMSGGEREARALLKAHPDLIRELAREQPDGGTPLHHAAWHGKVASARLLIHLGAPLDLQDKTFGCSPLGWAAHGSANCRKADDDYAAIVDLLLQAGASVAAAANKWGVAARDLASPAVAARFG